MYIYINMHTLIIIYKHLYIGDTRYFDKAWIEEEIVPPITKSQSAQSSKLNSKSDLFDLKSTSSRRVNLVNRNSSSFFQGF
jgi:hypothetical protein